MISVYPEICLEFENYDLEKNYSKMFQTIITNPQLISYHYEMTHDNFYDNLKNDWDWNLEKIKIGSMRPEEIIIDFINVFPYFECNELKNFIRKNIKDKYHIDIKNDKKFIKQYYHSLYKYDT